MNKLSDHELNRRVAERIYIGENSIRARKGMKASAVIVISNKLRHDIAMVDYCNNWNDLMPLVIKYNLSRTFMQEDETHDVFAPANQGLTSDGNLLETNNKNPQKALVECLIKVLESGK